MESGSGYTGRSHDIATWETDQAKDRWLQRRLIWKNDWKKRYKEHDIGKEEKRWRELTRWYCILSSSVSLSSSENISSSFPPSFIPFCSSFSSSFFSSFHHNLVSTGECIQRRYVPGCLLGLSQYRTAHRAYYVNTGQHIEPTMSIPNST
eukprot:1471751-Rhodomonas_salina.1